MRDNNEWFYAELLDFLKQKEKEKEDALYLPLQLELPLYEPTQIIGDEPKKEEQEKRGVVVIDL